MLRCALCFSGLFLSESRDEFGSTSDPIFCVLLCLFLALDFSLRLNVRRNPPHNLFSGYEFFMYNDSPRTTGGTLERSFMSDQTKPSQKFQTGDVVVLKSGGPKMTIDLFGKFGYDSRWRYRVNWIEGGKKHEEVFAEDVLEAA